MTMSCVIESPPTRFEPLVTMSVPLHGYLRLLVGGEIARFVCLCTVRFLRKITTQQLFSTRSLEATKDLRISKVQELMRFVDTCSQRKRSCEHRSRIIRQFTTLNIISNALFSTNLANFDDTEKRSASGDRWET
ncbi:hypothetical protein Bca52824_080121 [Brassica carinata]|uniref:Uncharacterized protein n=1 Tax=Brassica carinata TaxID=52824 RepID=A0A8X7Q0J0_BRACI|nr:hypothetical protein Bca52824_080121 [Brassica carinata]